MKNQIEHAQDYIDSGKPIPETVIDSLNGEESELLNIMLDFKQNIKHELNRLISDAPLQMKNNNAETEATAMHSYGFGKFILAAAAVLILFASPGIYRNIESRKLVKEDTEHFIGTITDTAWTESNIPDNELNTEWFDAEPIVLGDIYY